MSTRKDFLTTVAAAAATPAVTARPIPTTAPATPELTFQFDQTRFNEILAKNAKHKQCFGIMKLSGGAPLEGMDNSIRAYDDFLKEGPGSMQAVAVLYHGPSVGFAMDDDIWNDYLIPGLSHAPAHIREDVGTIKRGRGNPFKSEVRDLVNKGSSFFVCHNAIAGFSELLAGALKTDVRKTHAALMAGILPGAMVVPAGVMAINACQEAKFTYIAT